MRFAGTEYDGSGVHVALIDSGVNISSISSHHPINGYGVSLRATNHVGIENDFEDRHGHGTRIAKHLLSFVPKINLTAIRVTDEHFRTSADLLAAGIELASKSHASIIHVSMGTQNMGRALLLRDSCIAAKKMGAVIVASAHPKGERTYPADLPEVVGVSTHKDCRELFHFPKIEIE